MIKINIQNKDPQVLDLFIKWSLPLDVVTEYLLKKGYQIKFYSYIIPASEEFLVSEPAMMVNTFTATKGDEEQSPENAYDLIFQKELKSDLNLF